MNHSIESQTTSSQITATRVPDSARVRTLPRHFGRHMMTVEHTIYTFMGELVSSYDGGYWHFYELSNGGFYMAIEHEPLHVCVPTNGYEGEMSADAAGITVCLIAFSHLSFMKDDEVFARHFHWLRDFALRHAEAQHIFSAID